MAVIISDSSNPAYNGNLSTANAFYRVESSNIAAYSATTLTTQGNQWIANFANAGNCKGVIVPLWMPISAYYNPRGSYTGGITVALQEGRAITVTIASPAVATLTGHSFIGARSGITISYASPTVCTYASHGLQNDQPVQFTTTGGLPSGLSANTTYYARNVATNTFELAANPGDVSINTGSAGSGTHSFYTDCFYLSTTGALPTGLTALTTLYWANVIDANTFNIRATAGGSNINTSGTQSGVHTLWVNRAIKYNSLSTIFNGIGFPGAAEWFQPYVFTVPYPITTTVGAWRFRTDRWGGSYGSLITSDGTNPIFAAWCDNQVSATSGSDAIIFKDPIEIDTSFVLKAQAGTGQSSLGCCGWLCKQTTPSTDASVLRCTSPAASYTLTIDGALYLPAHSGIRIGASTASRVSVANKFIFNYQVLPTVGTVRGHIGAINFLGTTNTVAGSLDTYRGSKSTFICYGQYPDYQHSTLNGDHAIGVTSITLNDDVSTGTLPWAINDTIYIGKRDAQGNVDVRQYTITSVTGPSVGISPALANYKALNGAMVFNTKRGVQFKMSTNSATYNRTYALATHMPSRLILDGVDNFGLVVFPTYSTAALDDDDTANHQTWDIENFISHNYISGTNTYSLQFNSYPQLGVRMKNIYSFYQGMVSTLTKTIYPIGNANYPAITSGTYYIENLFTINSANNNLNVGGGGSATGTVKNVRIENGSYGALFSGVNCTVDGVYVYGVAEQNAAVYYSGMTYPLLMNNIKVNRCTTGLSIYSGAILGGRTTNLVFGDESANTVGDVKFQVGVLVQHEFQTPTVFSVVTPATDLPLLLSGSRLAASTYGGTASDNRNWLNYGYITSSGIGLSDTTTHTAGGYAIRYESISSTSPLNWDISIPTGNIQNKTMSVGVWMYINNAAYYGGVYQIPRLTINYDNGTVVYAEAAKSAGGWQYVQVSFTPATTYGQITASLSTMTDQTGSNAYVYFDDMSVLYPAGYVLSLGNLDLWANGLPVTPPISTSISAQDVWAADPSKFGAGTIGDSMNITKKVVANNLIKNGNTITIYEDDGVSTFRKYASTDYQRQKV